MATLELPSLKDLDVYEKKPFNYHFIQKELEKAKPYLNYKWKVQDNINDKLTNFIYWCESYDELIYYFEKENKKNEIDFSYVIHRWYNYKVSKTIEAIFTSYNICKAEKDEKHKEIDFYLFQVPFDLKVTVMPSDFFGKPKDFFKKRSNRNKLIDWFYENQSQGQRKHIANRLFVVCKGENNRNSNIKSKELKSDFELIHKQIENFLLFTALSKEKNQKEFFNKRYFNFDGSTYTPYGDAIIVKKHT